MAFLDQRQCDQGPSNHRQHDQKQILTRGNMTRGRVRRNVTRGRFRSSMIRVKIRSSVIRGRIRSSMKKQHDQGQNQKQHDQRQKQKKEFRGKIIKELKVDRQVQELWERVNFVFHLSQLIIFYGFLTHQNHHTNICIMNDF